ncbi:MAG: type I DNA topoisomerase [Lachnospiraceae bacterium]|nr:type I DNA topoisomerase [Lachnospiraceae bacterium]
MATATTRKTGAAKTAARKKNLVIVESPAKVKTIRKFLGPNYEVTASQGHVRDLPKSRLGIDVEHDYEPKYITIRGKGDLLASLRKQVKKADRIYLATDPDREGEAISWHLIAALRLDEMEDKEVYRITFNEITKNAVKESLKNARGIDMHLVDAQQTRRILDRMVGYRISPILWAKVKRGLSAGRVQSAALRMIADREEEIDAFIPEEYWTLDAKLSIDDSVKDTLTVHYYGRIGADGTAEKYVPVSGEEIEAMRAKLAEASFSVSEIRTSERTRKSPLPFTTSTLQQEASKQLNYTTQKTMRIAQQLYEGVEIKGRGTVALITYLRTDSTRVSEEALASSAAYILERYGEDYLQEQEKESRSGAKIQDAHEAIRPTDITLEPSQLKDAIPRDQLRLYQLIWKRFVASRMNPARYAVKQVRVQAADALFTASMSRLVFDGYQSVYRTAEEEEQSDRLSGSLQEDSRLTLLDTEAKQHFTQPQPHYTEASLVRAMEEQGIGRPSTYAPTISTILARHYITRENRSLYITELGRVVNDMMRQAFPSIVDTRFTANMESLLDGIAEGSVRWKTVIENFYPDLDEAVREAEADLEKVTVADEETEEICEKCGRHMVIKYGPHGKFLACPGFPECQNAKPYYEKIGVACPKCGKDLVVRMTKKGRRYYGCMGFPECDFMAWQRPAAKKCPACGGPMVIKGDTLVCMDNACGHSEPAPAAEEKE